MTTALVRLALFGFFIVCPLSQAEDRVVFTDDFNRADADQVGREWTTKGEVRIKDNALYFGRYDEEFRPRARRTFPAQEKGAFSVSFLFDWLRSAEGGWGLFIQLGNNKDMPTHIVYEKDLAKGVGINLVWGGREQVNDQGAGSFGYYKDGSYKELTEINDGKRKETIPKNRVLTIEVNLDAGSYRVNYGGKTYSDLPLTAKGPIDTVRFTAHLCGETGFSKSSIDDFTVRKGK